jgi:TrmH family RNA methyltransferase
LGSAQTCITRTAGMLPAVLLVSPLHLLRSTLFLMLTAQSRSRLTIVLVGARNPHNIGAAARAMQDFGFTDLRIVNDFAAPFEAARIGFASPDASAPVATNAAVAAQHVMASAQRFDTLADALADCTMVVGTTAIGERTLTQIVLPLEQAAPVMLTTLDVPGGRVALLFGSEKTGLTNQQLSHAGLLTTIPMFHPVAEDGTPTRHLSMNLGQAVAVCLYELARSGIEGAREIPVLHEAPATGDDRERLTERLLAVLDATGYRGRFPGNVSEIQVRQLAQQLGRSHREATTWLGILRQILWRQSGSQEE